MKETQPLVFQPLTSPFDFLTVENEIIMPDPVEVNTIVEQDHKIAPSGSTAARYASSSAGSIFATRIFFSHMRFNPTQKIRIEPTSAI